MFKNLKLRAKIVFLSMSATILPVLIIGVFVAKLNTDMRVAATEESISLAKTDLDHIAESVYRLAETQNDVLTKALTSYLNIAREISEDLGGISFAYENVNWNAVNQYTQNSMVPVELPKMLVGNTWFGQTSDLTATVPVVDEVKNLSEDLTCTVFQRMNSGGDMLRIATNVVKDDGTRAIGTYIPAPTRTASPTRSSVPGSAGADLQRTRLRGQQMVPDRLRAHLQQGQAHRGHALRGSAPGECQKSA
jgi:methyl-accepting chemotaxis protein